MDPSKEAGDPASSLEATSQSEEGGEVVTELTDNDVLLGRGSVSHEGNVQFREIIAGRRDEYMSIIKRQQKYWIARQVMSAVAKKGGRFLRRIESLVEAEQLGVPPGAAAWRVVDQASVLLKVKQALRERDSGQAHKRQAEAVSPMLAKKHPALQSAASPPQHPLPAISAIGTSGGPDTDMLLGTLYERLKHQIGDQQALNVLASALMSPRTAAPAMLQASLVLGAEMNPNIVALDQAQAQRVASLTQHGVLTHDPLSGIGGQSLAGAASLESLLASLSSQRGQTASIPPAAASLASTILGGQSQQETSRPAQTGPGLGTLDAYQAPAPPANDRLQTLVALLRGSPNDAPKLLPGGDGAFPPDEQERVIARLTEIGDIGGKGGTPSRHVQQPQRLIPSFFPEELRTETKGIVALSDSTNLDRKGHGSIYLSFSLTEMLILAVLCSFGIPSWNPSKLDRDEVFSPVLQPRADSATLYEVSWYDFSLLLQEAAKDWRDRQSSFQALEGIIGKIMPESHLENRAVAICVSYTSDCRQLAKTALSMLEKVKKFLEAMRERASAGPSSVSNEGYTKSAAWIETEIKRWAETLDCQSANGLPVAYTASDFLASHPEHKENSAFKLVSHCDQEACEATWEQIVTLSHARSMAVAVSSVSGLSARLERSLLNENTLSWEGMPRWWSLNSFYFDVELLKALLTDGYVGVQSATLSVPSAATSARSTEPMTFAKLGVTNKRLLQTRFTQLARLLARSEDDAVDLIEQILQPLNQKRLEERIKAYQSLV